MTLNRRHFLAAMPPRRRSGPGRLRRLLHLRLRFGRESDGGTLTFTTWGTDSELAGFRRPSTASRPPTPAPR